MRLPGSIAHGLLARAALVVLRLYLGGVFLASGLSHIREAGGSQYGVATGWGEMVIGGCLVIGLLTRFVSAVLLVVTLSTLLRQATLPADPRAVDLAIGAVSLALLIGAPGRTWGMDALLARRWPRSPFW